MKIIRYLFLQLYRAWVLLVFTVFMVIYLPGILLPFLFGPKGGVVGYFFLKVWSWTFSKLNAIPYHIYGRENMTAGKACIYVSNHTSYLDLPGIALTIPGQFRPLAKKELKKIPVFGWIAQSACIIVDRSSNESRKRSMDDLKEVLSKGISILIFPEGTQNRSANLLQPFYDGAFRIAIETRRPILPMVVLNAGKLMPPNKFHIEPGTVKIVAGEEIATHHLTLHDVQTLKGQVYEVMEKMIKENL